MSVCLSAVATAGQLAILPKTSLSCSYCTPLNHRQLSGFASFFSSSTTFGTPEIQFHVLARNHFTFSNLVEEHALIKNNSLATSPSTWLIEGYCFNERFLVKWLKPQEITIEALTLYFKKFFIDESSWDPYSLRPNVFSFQGQFQLGCHVYLTTDCSTVTSSITRYVIIIVYFFAKPNVVLLGANLLDSSEYNTLQNRIGQW